MRNWQAVFIYRQNQLLISFLHSRNIIIKKIPKGFGQKLVDNGLKTQLSSETIAQWGIFLVQISKDPKIYILACLNSKKQPCSRGLSFYVNCYFQSDSLESNSLTSEAKEGPQEAVHEFKLTSVFS